MFLYEGPSEVLGKLTKRYLFYSKNVKIFFVDIHNN